MNQFDQVAASGLARARPWDVIGAALGAPMLLWGFLDWFGTAGDAGGGVSGFFSGTGAAGIGLVLAAAAMTLNQVLGGRAHSSAAPPVAALLSAAASLIVLGGMVAKPDSATIEAGSVAGLLTAATQGGVLVVGWLRGSDKTVKAAKVQAMQARQAAADAVAQLPSQQLPPWPPQQTPWPQQQQPWPQQQQPWPQQQQPPWPR